MIKYVKGDATQPYGTGHKLILHCCNDHVPGAWGSGFVIALSKRWADPEDQYRRWSTGADTVRSVVTGPYRLGECQFVNVDRDITVVNMIGQHGTGCRADGTPPIDYPAIEECLRRVTCYVLMHPIHPTVHCPRFGAGLAGGDWNVIEGLLEKQLCAHSVPVTVYDFAPVVTPKNVLALTVEAPKGCTLDACIAEAVALSRFRGEVVEFKFNDVLVKVPPAASVTDVLEDYWGLSGIRSP